MVKIVMAIISSHWYGNGERAKEREKDYLYGYVKVYGSLSLKWAIWPLFSKGPFKNNLFSWNWKFFTESIVNKNKN